MPETSSGTGTETTQSPTTRPPETGTAGATTTPTSPPSTQTDSQPSPDTPEGRFEKFCRENPGACG